MASQESHETFTLNCVLWGEDFDSIFDVSITSDTKITDLKRAVCKMGQRGWLDTKINLWSVSTSSITKNILLLSFLF
jgi:hypothetical protein